MAAAFMRPWPGLVSRNHGKNCIISGTKGDEEKRNREYEFCKGDLTELDQYYGLVKRQLLRYQSPTSHLFPITSTDNDLASIRSTVCCFHVEDIL